MLAKIRQLGTDTVIYGVSTILGRFLTFLLVPFYTNVLAPEDYGIVAYVFSLVAFLNIVYAYGMESAYFKYATTREIGTPEQNFSTPFVTLLFSSTALSGLILLFSGPIAAAITIPRGHASIVSLAAGIMMLDTVVIVPFALLRVERKAWSFGALKLINVAVNVACNLVLLLVFHKGVEGIFISNLIASLVTLLILVPVIKRHFTPSFSRPLLRALLAFGLPYIPAGLASMVIQVIDRPILRALTNDATVGIYQANYRLGVFMMLIVSMYDYAWRPFFLTQAENRDAKPLFARVLTYFIAVSSFIFLIISFFIGDLVQVHIFGRFLIHPAYWSGLPIVPIVLLGYLFLGVYDNLAPGVYIEKKTGKLPGITLVGAVTNVIANVILIPILGMMGAALATLGAYAAMATAMYFTVQRFYRVAYEWDRIVKIVIVTAVIFFLPDLIHLGEYAHIGKIVFLFLFVVLLWLMQFFLPDELRAIRGLLTRGIHRTGG
jgi:O-antigen/teichoic acid export membrane protein